MFAFSVRFARMNPSLVVVSTRGPGNVCGKDIKLMGRFGNGVSISLWNFENLRAIVLCVALMVLYNSFHFMYLLTTT